MTDQVANFASTADALYSLFVDNTTDVTSVDAQAFVPSTEGPTTLAPCTIYNQPPCDPWIIAAAHFANYGNFIAWSVGIPGGFLTIVILLRLRPFNSASVWLLCISCTDLASLCTRLINQYTLQYKLIEWQDWSCKFINIFIGVCENCSFYFLVGVTVERFIAVWVPLKMSIWCTNRRAAIAIALIYAAELGLSIHPVETYRVNADKNCIMRQKYLAFWQYVYDYYIHVTISMTIPVVAVITLNILIYLRLDLSRKFQNKMTDQQVSRKDKQQNQINRMLMAASAWFVLCVSMEIIYRYGSLYIFPQKLPRDLVLDRARIIINNVSAVIRLYNHAANFVLYVIAARKFRSEVIKLLTCNKYVAIYKRATPATNKLSSTGTMVTSHGETLTN